MTFLRKLRVFFTGNYFSRSERLEIYKAMREEIKSGKYYGFCHLLKIFDLRFGKIIRLKDDLPELLRLKPTYGWDINDAFWFERLLIEPRLALLDKIIAELEK